MVSTYHAFAGSLLRDYGLLLPVEPDTRLLGETELWQLAFDVVNAYRGELRTDKAPAAVTSMVLRLWNQLAEHLVDTRQLRDTHLELERWRTICRRAPTSETAVPANGCCGCCPPRPSAPSWCRCWTPCRNACAPRRPWTSAHRWRPPRGWPRPIRRSVVDLRNRYRVVLLDEYQDTGHAQRVALSSTVRRVE